MHVTTERGVNAIERARKRGSIVFGETCPQYLLLTDSAFDKPGFEGAKFVCSPPLRKEKDKAALWRALLGNVLHTIGTDHCPFFYEGQKDLGKERFTDIPGGIPGIEARLALIFTNGVLSGKISLGTVSYTHLRAHET